MTFTTWTALYTAMLDTLSSGNASIGSVSAAGKTITYKTNKEFMEQLLFVKMMSDQESDAAVRRTYAKQGGRGV